MAQAAEATLDFGANMREEARALLTEVLTVGAEEDDVESTTPSSHREVPCDESSGTPSDRQSLGNLEQLAAQVERGIFNWSVEYARTHGMVRNWVSGKFCSLYLSKLRSMAANLAGDASYVGNTRLVTRLREGEFRPHELAGMKPENVFPEVWKKYLDMKLMRDQFSEKPEAMTDQFRCGRCKKRECVYQELQLRSSDEPMSLFITCLNCGHRWRLG